MATDGTGNPLIEALPPNTDYLTYLTVIEYNLTPELLPTLHEVLQDTKLTVNIGWDLVHLLLPLLPASQQCLQDIARLGNPREVILKVTECLRLIDFQGLEPDFDDEQGAGPSLDADSYQHPHTTAAVDQSGHGGAESTQAVEVVPTPLPVDQFICLLSMLSILHPRVKTQYPSRFLSTSLQAVLHAFSHSVSHREELVSFILRFIKDIGGTKRPHLPPRTSSSQITATKSKERAPDPEPDTEADAPPLSESDMQTRLLQSLLTFVLEEYMLRLTSSEDVPGLAWSSRLQEKLHPERTVPGRPSFTDKFERQPDLKRRLTTIGEILALSQDLGIKTDEILKVAQANEQPHSRGGPTESEPPKTAADIPYSKSGSLLLYVARIMRKMLYSAPSGVDVLTIFPAHQQLLSSFVSGSSTNGAMIGSEPEALLDALLTLAVMAIEKNEVGQPPDAEAFNRYLQSVSLISSNCPSPSLRFVAYYLTTTILRSNPSDIERLAFIRDTLEHCPFDNLKVAAVSWIKGETIEANETRGSPRPSTAGGTAGLEHESQDKASIFATPVALDTLSPYLFPDLTHDLSGPSISDSWMTFDQNLQFYLASLNFYFLLVSADHLTKGLNIGNLHTNSDIGGSFLGPLKEASTRFQEAAKSGGELAQVWKEDGSVDTQLAKLQLLDATLEKVTQGVAKLNATS
ncbi:hypothetical protein CAC42_2529 [Sphaceloma murrayae]|uniref:YAP1-binding protein 2 n=1 Tax=Sphaceloma murrayae TaxID=2082308 RepID=A0A2K1QWB7_9PEZI|nr:hypothetical protein CAC42_2529 [Sphaceloma murrayae]